MFNSSLMIAGAIALARHLVIALVSILVVEVVRDLYHFLAHVWQPLYRLHGWHHRIFKPDLSVKSEEIYRQANWYNDLPESLVILLFGVIFAQVVITNGLVAQNYQWLVWTGCFYTITYSLGAIARGLGIPYADAITDVTHRQGEFQSLPGNLFVNRTYHWRHHFDDQDAYFCGTLTLVDRIMGTALSLKGKKIAVTGASGTLGEALMTQLHQKGAKVTALTSKEQELSITVNNQATPVNTVTWAVGKEEELRELFEKIDILIINHGINVYGDKSPEAIATSYQVNAFSGIRMMELFLDTVKTNRQKATKEIWVNTSEAEVSPAFSPLYELSKRTMGDIVTLRRTNAPCVIRKLILGPFKSNLNPVGVMSASWVAKQIVNLAQRDFRNIIVTINPITYIFFPLKEFFQSIYFKLFTK
ncbi:fatty acid hydroxylase [Cyanobacterium stanieri PCC 7202]|uniref:Fatty acid hydroxylase n=1 Tax=Cyanobacterium stanieri (strain ATCC 29140 / PCC 7202) TaxID=292563 RepID=K9YKU4_CYASC|nr:fatty acid hydroxylase [Cyanobacterium stanieri PCC 7202]